jgi:hypothetical protein
MNLTIDDIPKILDLYEVVGAEIACSGMRVTDFSSMDIAQRIVTLWNAASGSEKNRDLSETKYSLILTAKEIAALAMVFDKIEYRGGNPDEIMNGFCDSMDDIRNKLMDVIATERYG